MEERERFLQEAHLLERLKHHNILHIFDVGIHEGFPYIVAEYAPYGSLRNLIREYAPRPVPTAIALNVLTQIGQALSYAHQQNIIHRDLKPENILFNAERAVLLADFGIATTLSTASIKQVNVVGTPAYMAPEQFQSTISKESDQYGLGCIAYELFTGKLPFDGTDFFAIGFQHMEKSPTPPTQLNPTLPLHVEHAILKAMAKQRHDRYVDINAFITALHTPVNAQAQSPISTLPTVTFSYNGTANPTNTFSTYQLSAEQHSNKDLSQQHSVGGDVNGSRMAPYRQVPETPLPPVYSASPSTAPTYIKHPYSQDPITQLPPVTDKMQPTRENATVLPSMHTLPSAPQYTPFAASWPVTGPANNYGMMPASYPVKPVKGRRHWLLIAVAALLVVASLLGIFFFAFPPKPTTPPPGLSLNVSTPKGGNTPSGLSPIAKSTHSVSTRVPTTTPKQTPLVATPTNTATATPTPTVTPTPTPHPSEQLVAYFISGESAATTKYTYTGTVSISVSGTGQADSTSYSDALYIYTATNGSAITPKHSDCWVLYIDAQSVQTFTPNNSVPAYQSSHSYSFSINAPGGTITFGVCDSYTSDNTGYYSITVTQK